MSDDAGEVLENLIDTNIDAEMYVQDIIKKHGFK